MTTRARRFFLNEIAKQNREEKKKSVKILNDLTVPPKYRYATRATSYL